jgi:hypothetical protein
MSSAATCASCDKPLPGKPVLDDQAIAYCSGLCRLNARNATVDDELSDPEVVHASRGPDWESEIFRQEQLRQGKKIAVVIIASVLALSALASVVDIASGAQFAVPVTISRVLSRSVLCYLVWRGFGWARWLLGLNCMSAILAPIVLAVSFQLPGAAFVLVFVMALPIFGAGVLLLSSKPLKAFLSSQRLR